MAAEYAPEVVADLQAMVQGGLPAWGLSPHTEVTLLNLSENATFRLRDEASGRDLVIRLHRVGYSSPEEIRSELAWIEALRREEVIETAPLVAGTDGQPVQILRSPAGGPARHAVAFERVAGKEPEQGDDLVGWFRVLGGVTARMHAHAKRWRRPKGFVRKVWTFDAMVGPAGYWGPWRAGLGLDKAGTAVIEQALARIEGRVARLGMGPERFGLVHADLRLANLLVEDDHLRVIDFDDCGLSWYVYDFAAAISFIEHEPIVPALLDAWVEGYQAVAPLSAAELAEIPTFIVLRRILLTAWLASHAEIPFARQMGTTFTQGTVALAARWLEQTA
ncbi:phosphotransferase enzyme family protein [Rhodospirillum rubrum]|uniref:Aminoglycoside phosphotransferase n=1 Tax=Rhodospirillum rubrum (strain ATCC 11170 / ATH 1.1.1 / DSM 467 / LMG 4362 / NCIMB 8255 / S1) TaxID=269796 RepID=Q2RPY4_RHORT|nr:phosphotransferase [Rhodospirillum rubrum]ABC23811.1 Aminoglycoside phosphotransferase [Rhodospirillum rubrum ATCC 11170]AEO49551.1 aminoglycoside phosphotransferase [Rhodospirillum rubrum F11]MBK5955487.1 aminoglycoside phosphotransferase [Rhodospirillum rubrum]QXG79758.1 phosphotransferase [Rhodospirillum rubrum]